LKSAQELSQWLPPEYEIQHGPRAWMATLRAAAPAIARTGYGLQTDGSIATSDLSGRRPLLELPTTEGVLLVRRFSHGGLLRWLTGSRFSDPLRPFRELRTSRALAALDVRTPEVVAARARRAAGLGWRLDLVTRRVEGTIDLGRFVAMVRRGERERSELRRVLSAAGAFVRRLHDVGLVHADLTPNNMLVETASLARGTPRLWIVDLEGARFESPLEEGARRANLRRLFRFVARREERHGRVLGRADFLRFMRGYDPEGARWKRDWAEIEDAHRKNRTWHRWGWWLESRFRAERDAREHVAPKTSR
jgi:tRNA A-37 threonylcarbamoyl transferase component Bud32